jgi:hypothetical protein
LLLIGELAEQLCYLFARAGIKHREGLPAFGSERKDAPPGVGLGRSLLDEVPALQTGQDSAEVTRVQTQIAREVGGGRLLAVGDLEQYAGLGERVGRVK